MDTTVSDWAGAILFFGGQNDGNSNTFEVAAASVTLTVTLTSGGIFLLQSNMNGLGVGGPFFKNPIGDKPRGWLCERIWKRRDQILVPVTVA